jgi:ferric-dicitrate binding protein FerR (iron transport regulator)
MDDSYYAGLKAEIARKQKRKRRIWALLLLGAAAYLWLMWWMVKTAPTHEELRQRAEEQKGVKIEECRAACLDPYCTVSFDPTPGEDINCVCTCDQFAEEID